MAGVLTVVWMALKDAFLMAWQVWWALVFGFAISAIVQAWVPRERIQNALSGGGVAPVARGVQGRRPGGGGPVVLVRRHRHRQEPLPEGCVDRVVARVPVRLDEP